MLIQFDLGDWSWDGHKVTFTIVADCSHSAQEVADAYQRACRRFSFVLHERVCGLYEEYAIRVEDLAFLQSLGYTPAPEFDPASVKPEDMFAMFMTFVHAGDPGIAMTVFAPEPFFVPGTPDRSFHLGYGALSGRSPLANRFGIDIQSVDFRRSSHYVVQGHIGDFERLVEERHDEDFAPLAANLGA